MSFFQWLRELIAKDLIDSNTKLNNLLVDKERELNECRVINLEKNDIIGELEKQIIELRDKAGIQEEKPHLHEDLYETDTVYLGQRVFYTKSQLFKYPLPTLQDYFVVSPTMIRNELKNVNTDGSYLDKFKRIVAYVQNKYEYAFDANKFGVNENWESIENLLITKKGDCETMSMLVVMLCRFAGIPENKVFMSDGLYITPTEEIGHAFPVLWDKEWYVGEPTNKSSFVDTWEKLKYKYVSLWGMGNDVFSVKIKGDKTYLK